MIPGFSKFSYKNRLLRLQLPTLRFRRFRGDMIQVFQILSGCYDSGLSPNIVKSHVLNTRGHYDILLS